LDATTTEKLATMVAEGVIAGFEQDVEIFKNKAKIDNPLLCDEDGPIHQLRRWYEQFYVDVADIAPDMTQRFEREVDTSYPASVWSREVEEGLAQQSAPAAEASAVPAL
jgi:3-ketosteroid 9alpha-monooxygenase subunit A